MGPRTKLFIDDLGKQLIEYSGELNSTFIKSLAAAFKKAMDLQFLAQSLLGKNWKKFLILHQTVIFVPSTLILSTYLQETSMKLIPILVITFALGRMVFAMG